MADSRKKILNYIFFPEIVARDFTNVKHRETGQISHFPTQCVVMPGKTSGKNSMARSHSLQLYLMAFWHEVNMDFFSSVWPINVIYPPRNKALLQRCQREFRTHRLSLHIKNAVRSFVWKTCSVCVKKIFRHPC